LPAVWASSWGKLGSLIFLPDVPAAARLPAAGPTTKPDGIAVVIGPRSHYSFRLLGIGCAN
jgi:hypothetical protein